MKKEFQEALNGQFTTVREELFDMAKEAADEIGCDWYEVADCGEYAAICYTDDDGEDAEIEIKIENAGSTWCFTEVR